MEHRLQMGIILLLVMGVSPIAQETFVQSLYKKTEPGQNITEKIGAELTVVSKVECSIN